MEDRNARFDEIAHSLSLHFVEIEEFWKLLDEILPDKEEQKAYSQYHLGKILPHRVNPSGILTPAQFSKIADTINFLNPIEYKKLLPGLTWVYRPWIALGYENTTLYRLLPSIHNFSTPQRSVYSLTNHDGRNPAFFSVNTTSMPHEPSLPLNRRAHVLDLPEESAQLVELDGAGAPEIIFHELGLLQCLNCETADEMPTTPEEGDDVEGDWEPTGFCVVARLSDAGHISGVYIIHNVDREQVTHGAWGLGIPPSSTGEQFSSARIGSAMGDFGYKVKLVWSDQIHHPVELVWSVRSSIQ